MLDFENGQIGQLNLLIFSSVVESFNEIETLKNARSMFITKKCLVELGLELLRI